MTARDHAVPDYQTVIVGAGFSGIGTAIQLDRSGLSDYLVVEAGDEPGGTWYWNTYPGIAVDIPSFSYQFSFEQSTAGSRTYAPGNELQAYAAHCVNKYGLRPTTHTPACTPRCTHHHTQRAHSTLHYQHTARTACVCTAQGR